MSTRIKSRTYMQSPPSQFNPNFPRTATKLVFIFVTSERLTILLGVTMPLLCRAPKSQHKINTDELGHRKINLVFPSDCQH